MNRIFHGSRAVVAVAAGMLAVAIGGPASAEQVEIDFDDLIPGPSKFTKTDEKFPIERTLSSGEIIKMEISGGQILTSPRFAKGTTVYGTAPRRTRSTSEDAVACWGCTGGITLDFGEQAQSSVTFTVINSANPTESISNRVYGIKINGEKLRENWLTTETISQGERTTFTVSSDNYSGSIETIRITDFNRVSDFYVDDILIGEGTPAHLVSFRVFIPGNNAPAGPNVSCVAMPETTTDGVTRAPQVVRGVTASVASATPRALYFAGDDRGHEAAADSYRVFQSASVIPDKSSDLDGRDDGIPNKKAAKAMFAFAEDAISSDEIITQAWDDLDSHNGGDCRWYHQTYALSANNSNVKVKRVDRTSVSVRFSGSVNTPLAGKSGKGAMDWDMTLTLDTEGFWQLSGAHDGFPAYEIYIDGKPVYQSNPDDGPDTTYSFARDVRKLLPPMDVRVNVSGP